MATHKGYCQYCGYFHGVEQSTFVVTNPTNLEYYDGEFAGTGKKRVSGRCTRCGGVEFLIIGGDKQGLTRKAGRGAARGAWGLAKGLAKATGAVAAGSYQAAKWGYEKLTEEDAPDGSPGPDVHDAGGGYPELPPEVPAYDEVPDSRPPPLPEDVVAGWAEPYEPGDVPSATPPEIPDDVFATSDGSSAFDEAAGQIADRPDPDGFPAAQEDPYGDRPEELRISWRHEADQADAYNEIDDTPLEDDGASEPLPHEGPLEQPDRGPHPDYTKPPPREQIQAYDDQWRRDNYGKVSRDEWEAHDAEYRRQLHERKRLDLEGAGGRIDYGEGSYEELLPDGTIHTSEVKAHGAGSHSSYESWERPDGSSTSISAADESSTAKGSAGSETVETSTTSRIDFDGESSHSVESEAKTRRTGRREKSGPDDPAPGSGSA